MLFIRKFHNYFAKEALSKILKKKNISFEDAYKNIYVGLSQFGGFGVFSLNGFNEKEIIEVCPTIEIEDRNVPRDLNNYLFENNLIQENIEDTYIENEKQKIVDIVFTKKHKTGYNLKEEEQENCKLLLPFGYGMLYNHSDIPNAFSEIIEVPLETEIIQKQKVILFFANKQINKNEEIFISYGKSWWKDRGWKPFRKHFSMHKIFYPSQEE